MKRATTVILLSLVALPPKHSRSVWRLYNYGAVDKCHNLLAQQVRESHVTDEH